MPTLVWTRLPKSGTNAASEARSAIRREAAVPDAVVTTAVPDQAVSSGAALAAASSSKQHAGRGKEKKRKINRAEAVKSAKKKKSKASSERNLPTGVHKSSSGNKFRSIIRWRGKNRCIGSFDTPEQASAAYISVRKDRVDAKLLVVSTDEVDALFDAAQKKALKTVGGFSVKKEGLPTGVYKSSSGKFQSMISWGEAGKSRYIGTFDTPKKASAAHMSAKKELEQVNLSAFGADEVDAAFDAAKTKALSSCGMFKRDLPKGVYKTRSGKFQARIYWGGKNRSIGTFDTPEQTSAAYISVNKGLVHVKPSDDVNAAFDAAKTKALKSFEGSVPAKRELPQGVNMTSSGNFRSMISWGGKNRSISSFDTAEQASVAYLSTKEDLDAAKLSAFGADKVDAIFDAAKKKALETAESMKETDKYGDEFLV